MSETVYWPYRWWAMPNELGENRWIDDSFRTPNTSPVERAAFRNLYRASEMAKEIRGYHARYVAAQPKSVGKAT